MKRDLFYASKKFLNRDGHHSDATILTEIEFGDKEAPWMDCTLKIKDCSNQIHLTIELDYDDSEEVIENTFFKLDTLITELQKFKEVCGRAHEESKRRAQIQKENEEREKAEREATTANSRDSNNSVVLHTSNPSDTPLVGPTLIR